MTFYFLKFRYEVAYYRGAGMCVIELDVPTGFEADLEGQFTDLYQSKKSEIRNRKTVVLYYDEVRIVATVQPYVYVLSFYRTHRF